MRELVTVGGYFYVLGGQRVTCEFNAVAYRYDPSGDAWTERSMGPYAADGVAGGAYNNIIYIFGGRQDNTGPYGTTYAAMYTPGSDVASLWTQVAGDLYMSGGSLNRVVPPQGSLTGLPASVFPQLSTASYQTSGAYAVGLRPQRARGCAPSR
jgi:Kelch motif